MDSYISLLKKKKCRESVGKEGGTLKAALGKDIHI